MARIVLHLTLRQHAGEKEIEFSLQEPMSLLAFLESRNIPADQVGLVVRNGRWEDKNTCIIHNDDRIELFPFLQGG
ncbi:MAG TPA: MoaD/ThiS family protein [Firmicutes bacterium]|jgi:sulfur carrier protein ThiS|nr:MoaD/ThiS family protein [Bacillota bacterium]